MTENEQVNAQQAQPEGTGQQPAAATFTQADVDRLIGQTRQEARERAQRDLVEKYGNLEELVSAKAELDKRRAAEMSEMEKLQAQIEELKAANVKAAQDAQRAALDALKLEVGQEKGLTPTLAKRLTGATREELVADAEAILADLKPQKTPPDIDATAGGAGTVRAVRADLTAQERATAAKFGMTEEQYLKNKSALMKGE